MPSWAATWLVELLQVILSMALFFHLHIPISLTSLLISSFRDSLGLLLSLPLLPPTTVTQTVLALQGIRNGKAPGFEFLTNCWLIKQKNGWRLSTAPPSSHESCQRNSRKERLSLSWKQENLKSSNCLIISFNYNELNPIKTKFLLIVQAGFRLNRNCEDQILAMTTFIDRGFEQLLKTWAVFPLLPIHPDRIGKTQIQKLLC